MNSCVRLRLIVAVLVSLFVPVSLRATSFPTMVQYPIGPAGLTNIGDFNGDGLLDIVVLSQCSPEPCSHSSIAVSLANGIGQFAAPLFSVTVGKASGFVVGDFDRDQKLDIAFQTLQPETSAIAVVRGNGNGTFGAATLTAIPPSGAPHFAGDVNGDQKLDLIFMAERSQLRVVLGSGNGSFRALPDAPGGYGECVLADVNNDSKLDLVGTSIQLGNGDGTFQAAQTILAVGDCPVVADFNGDGNLDLAEQFRNGIGVDPHHFQDGVNLYLGNGDGSFQNPVFRWIGGNEQSGFSMLAPGDFNADGKTDLLAVRGQEVAILLNEGSARFRPAVGYLEVGWPILADLNGDRRTDLLFIRNIAGDKMVAIAALAGFGGIFSLPRSFFLPGGTGPSFVMSGDLNNDGKLDVIELNSESAYWSGGHLNRLLGNGDGTFRRAADLVTGGRTSYFGSLCDLNLDGKIDVLTVSTDSVNARLGLGDGTFESPINYLFYPAWSPWGGAALADFNGDQIPDVVVNRSHFGPGLMLLGNGNGTFRSGAPVLAQFDWVAAGDFNGDGKQDLAVAPTSATGSSISVGIMLGNGDGTFQTISVLQTGHTARLLAADFNSDGKLDLAAVDTTPTGNTTASVYLGNGDGTLQAPLDTWVRGRVYPRAAIAADFNQDGKMDLAVSVSSNEIVLLRGNGAGRFRTPQFYLGGGPLVAGDFDSNGTQDLGVVTSSSTFAILLNE